MAFSSLDEWPASADFGGSSRTFLFTNDLNIIAQAFKEGYLPSEPVYLRFRLPKLATPEFEPAGVHVTNNTLITITSPDPGAVIHFMLNGPGLPDATSPVYTKPIAVSAGDTLYAIARKDGYNPSEIRGLSYSSAYVEIAYSPRQGSISRGSAVTLTPSVPGAVVYYSLDGGFASPTSSIYTGPIVVSNNTWISAAGIKPAYGSITWKFHYGMVINDDGARVETLAGDGIADYGDGPAATAEFFSPSGLCLDSKGNLYVADTGNYRVRRISEKGTVKSIAGLGLPGLRDGPAKSARFSTLKGICLDPAGNLYVADSGNFLIRRIDPEGVVSTYATMNTPLSYLDVDRLGNLYAGVPGGVLKVLPRGKVEGFAFIPASEVGVAVDMANSVIVIGGNSPMSRFDAPGSFVQLTHAEPFWAYDGSSSSSGFEEAQDATVDRLGNIYVTDGNRVRKVGTDGYVTTLAGTGEAGYREGLGSEAQFDHPSGLSVDADGNVYVADTGNHRIRKIVQSGSAKSATTGGNDMRYSAPGLCLKRQVTGSRLALSLSWLSVVGVTYQLQASADLATWENIGAPSAGNGQLLTVDESMLRTADNVRFFRIIVR